MKRLTLMVFIIAMLVVTGCNGGNSGGGSGNISVRVSPSKASMDAGRSQVFTAALTNDATGAGVHWTASGGTLSNVTPTSATLTASNTAGNATISAASVAQPSSGASVDVTVAASPTISNSPMPDAVFGKPYSAQVPFSGGVLPIAFAVTSGALPGGLAIDAASGAISGAPNATGSFPFTIQATDSSSTPAQVALSKNIAVRTPLAITPAIAPTAEVGAAFSLALAGTGGVQPYAWSVSAGSLPPGLSLNSTTGAITGTPSAAGGFSATIQLTDAGAPAQTATLSLGITASAQLTINTTMLSDPTNGLAYSATISASGGTAPLTFSISAGALPAGLAINASTGAITGIPSVTGTVSFTAHVADSSTTPQTANQALSIRVNAPLAISSLALPSAAINVPYDALLTASGAVSPLTWSVTLGSLPVGLSLNGGTGIVSGTPTTTGTTNFTVQVTDSANPPRTASHAVGITVNSQFAVTALPPPNATVLIPYLFTPTVSGGTLPLNWTLTSGTLPAGLSLVAGTGIISGIPTTAGSSSFTLQVTDSSTPSQSATFPATITVNPTLSIVSTLLSNAITGVPYVATITAAGSVPPLTWSVSAGALPTGLSLNATTGIISGTPTGSGTSNFTLHVTDSATPARSSTLASSITVNSLLAITPAILPDAVSGVAYSSTLALTGGVGPFTWSLNGGALPAGLTLSSSGVLSGTPGASGIFTFTSHVSDSSVPAQTANFVDVLHVDTALSITSLVLPNATVSLPYVGTLLATGGTAPYTWAVSAGTLPAGLSLSGSTGIISGTPTATGTSNFTVQVTDSSHPALTTTLAVSIKSNTLLSILPITLPNAVVGVLFNASLSTSGAVGPVSWAVTAGTLPGGVSLNASTGVLSGIPLAAAVGANFTVQATDSAAPPRTATLAVNLTVNTALTITPIGLPNAVQGVPYVGTFVATGGSLPYTWAVSAGTLPAGLSLSSTTGIVTGIPTATGTSSFTVRVTDASNPAQAATLPISITSNAALSILPITLPNAVVGVLFNTSLSTSGAVGPVSWSVTAGTLPGGVSLNASTGVLSGTPLAAALGANFTVQATDSAAPPRTATLAVSLTVNTALTITPIVLPNAIQGVPYVGTAVATGGTLPYTWTVSAGTLPAGLSLGSSTGIISGTPTSTGTSSFTLRATDASNPAQATTLPLNITSNAPLSILPITLPNAIVGVVFNASLSTSGAVGPVSWSVTAGTLPGGLSLNASTGVLSGTPLTAVLGANFTVQAKDSATPPRTATLAVGLTVNSALTITPIVLPNAIQAVPYVGTVVATGGTAPYTWAVSAGTLPTGLSLGASTGIIAGTPTSTGTNSFTVRVTDSSSPAQTTTLAVNIVTNSALSILPVTLLDSIIGSPYSASISTSGGVGPVTFAVSAGTLPAGLSLNASTGALTGTPSGVAGAAAVTIKATDSSVPAQIQTMALTFHTYLKLSISPISLPGALLGSAYSANLTATGGTGTYTWSVSAGTLPGGISLNTATGALSGNPLLALLANFTIQVTDNGNPAQTATLALSLTVTAPGVNNSLFSGNYAFLFQGFDANGPVGIAGSINANADGSVISGVMDINRSTGAQMNVSITSGIFAVNADNRGTLTLTTSLGTQAFRIAFDAAGTLGHMIEVDAPSPTVIRGNGIIKHQNSAAFSNPSITGNYAFGISGSTSTGGHSGLIGSFLTNGAGGITSGLADANSASIVANNKAIANTSTYNVASTTDGRGTLTLNVAGLSSAVSGVIYVVSSSDLLFLRTDTLAAGVDMLGGEIMQQSGNPFAGLPLAGVSIVHVNGTVSSAATSAGAGLLVTTGGLGLVTATYDANDNGTVTSSLAVLGSYSVTQGATGQGTLSFAGNQFLFYLVNSTTAFVMDATSAEAKTGMFEGQSVLPITLTSLVGNYVEGTEANTSSSISFESGILGLDVLGNLTGTTDDNAVGDVLTSGNAISGVLSLLTDGRATIGTDIYYVVTPTRFVHLQAKAGQTNASVLIADK